MTASNELQLKGKQEAPSPAEQIRPGPVFTPEVDIFETDHAIILLADMPGVCAEDIKIDLNDAVLTLSGNVKPWEKAGDSYVLYEFQTGQYYRQFTLSEIIDQSKIEARFENGVLRLTLPKAEKAVPRKISVAAG